jgi:hypothetical protein
MGYRDDHDAALARIEALERENARLVEENAALRRGEPAKPRPHRSAKAVWSSVGVVIAIPLIIIVFAMRDCDVTPGGFDEITKSAGSGALISNGPTLGGAWRLELGRCVSGQRTQFYGVDLVDKTDANKILRIVEDPVRGTIVKMNVVGQSAARFIERTECTTWDIAMQPTNTTVNGIRLLDGHVALDCKFADGGTLTGRIDFKRCN